MAEHLLIPNPTEQPAQITSTIEHLNRIISAMIENFGVNGVVEISTGLVEHQRPAFLELKNELGTTRLVCAGKVEAYLKENDMIKNVTVISE